LHEGSWAMSVPLVALAIGAVAAGWANLPAIVTEALPVGPTALLDRWLDPVVGEAVRTIGLGAVPHLDHGTELILLSLATLVAMAGVGGSVWWYRRVPVLAAREDQTVWTGINRILARKYYVDELYDAVFVRPTLWVSRTVLYRGIDRGLIDWLSVEGAAWRFPTIIGRMGSALQNGRVSTYAWVLVVGVLVLLFAMGRG